MPEDNRKSPYADTWDRYVTEDFPRIQKGPPRSAADLRAWQVLNTTDDGYVWPGDEWGDAAAVARILQTCLFGPFGAERPSRLCELASGAGRFTAAVMAKWPKARIDCFDVSQAFLEQFNRRFEKPIAAGLIRTFLLSDDPMHMYTALAETGMARQIDAIFSFDAMVHVELHSLAIYVATAAAVLKPGGLLAMNVADATNANGFQKLLFDAPFAFRRGGTVGPQFQFASPDILRRLLGSLGFSHEFHDMNGRDLFFTAKLQDISAAPRSLDAAGARWWPAS